MWEGIITSGPKPYNFDFSFLVWLPTNKWEIMSFLFLSDSVKSFQAEVTKQQKPKCNTIFYRSSTWIWTWSAAIKVVDQILALTSHMCFLSAERRLAGVLLVCWRNQKLLRSYNSSEIQYTSFVFDCHLEEVFQ